MPERRQRAVAPGLPLKSGTVVASIQKPDDHLRLTILDDGVGMAPRPDSRFDMRAAVHESYRVAADRSSTDDRGWRRKIADWAVRAAFALGVVRAFLRL